MPAIRQFTRPWHVIEYDAHFEVVDAAGISLAIIYFDTERQPMKGQSKDQARQMARKIARLPAPLWIEKGIDPGEA